MQSHADGTPNRDNSRDTLGKQWKLWSPNPQCRRADTWGRRWGASGDHIWLQEGSLSDLKEENQQAQYTIKQKPKWLLRKSMALCPCLRKQKGIESRHHRIYVNFVLTFHRYFTSSSPRKEYRILLIIIICSLVATMNSCYFVRVKCLCYFVPVM